MQQESVSSDQESMIRLPIYADDHHWDMTCDRLRLRDSNFSRSVSPENFTPDTFTSIGLSRPPGRGAWVGVSPSDPPPITPRPHHEAFGRVT